MYFPKPYLDILLSIVLQTLKLDWIAILIAYFETEYKIMIMLVTAIKPCHDAVCGCLYKWREGSVFLPRHDIPWHDLGYQETTRHFQTNQIRIANAFKLQWDTKTRMILQWMLSETTEKFWSFIG